jgi:hypothetical protein
MSMGGKVEERAGGQKGVRERDWEWEGMRSEKGRVWP